MHINGDAQGGKCKKIYRAAAMGISANIEVAKDN